MKNKNINILHLEDNDFDVELVKSTLDKEELNFNYYIAQNKEDYIDSIKKNKNKIDLILADYSLPSFNGTQALEIAKDLCPQIPFIFLSGAIGEEIAIESLKSGATDYILKDQLKRLGNSIIRALNENEEKKRRLIAEEKLHLSYEKLTRTFEQIVEAFSSLSEKKDPYTAGHQRNVSLIASAIGKKMKLSEDEIQGLRIAANLHDIGKIYVPSEILNKPGKLSEYEFNIVKTHPQVGYDILKEIQFPWPVSLIVLQHHEKIDGSGYPTGMKGENILLEAKILAVADVIEAMVSHRPYRPSLGLDKALLEISQNKGIIYDAEIVNISLKLFMEKEFTINEINKF